MQQVLDAVWAALNSPVGIALIASGVLLLLNRLYKWRPAWQQYEGAVIAAVKWAEKQIPDSTPNHGMQRLDVALKYVLRIYEETTGKRATPKIEAEFADGIQLKHAELEAAGTLKGSKVVNGKG